MSSANLVLPLNFGDRPCDRLFLDSLSMVLPGSDEKLASWFSFRIWKDFAIARDDRREVPLDPAARRGSPVVRVLERYAGWAGPSGDLVECAIAAGFFTLVKVSDSAGQLVLTDFFPANRQGASDISNSRLGGAGKSVKQAGARAAAMAREQMDMFRKSDHHLLKNRSEAEVSDGALFIHQLCNILRKPAPQAKEWREELIAKSLAIKGEYDREAIYNTFRWLNINRDSQEIPDRLDFLLDQFGEFHAKAVRDIPVG